MIQYVIIIIIIIIIIIVFDNFSPKMHRKNFMTVTNSRAKATANPVGGKACSSTKGGLLRYIPNTYSNHKVSSFLFAHYYPLICR